jgi:YD repeat-containing protein
VYSGNCATATDEQGKNRETCSDGLGRLTTLVENPGGLGYPTTYTYDALGDLTQVVQNGLRQRNFTYNSLAQLTQAINPESGTIQYAYDPDGNLRLKDRARAESGRQQYGYLVVLLRPAESNDGQSIYRTILPLEFSGRDV